MLLELRVENLLLIERAELRLGPGLNAITGETGAGKTVLAQALDLLLGGKPRSGIVRPGAPEAYVEGVFELLPGLLEGPELEPLRDLVGSEAEEVVLARRVFATGRSRAFVQGRSATAGDLQELGGRLVAFYGQHEHRKLTVGSAQLAALDGFAGIDLASYARAHARAGEARREVESLRAAAGERDRGLGLLVYEIEEIEALDPSVEDKAGLSAERGRLRHLEGLRAASGGAAEALAPIEGSGAALLLGEAEAMAAGAEGVDPELDALSTRVRALRIEADELASDLRVYESSLDGEPGRIELVEERLEGYDRLERKHGGSVEAVLAHAERCRTERDRLENAEVALEQAQAAVAEAESAEAKQAAELSKARAAAAPALERRVLAELAELALQDASFEVRLTGTGSAGASTGEPRTLAGSAGASTGQALGANGAERAEFLIAPNPGVPATPLRETASGGELSRVMLALMGVAAAGDGPTLVFDEVDAGIGGQTARAVGERLRGLAEGRQVICITHLPQIASLAARHFRIAKDTSAEVATTSVEALADGAVVEELCRMLGADSKDAGARRHAEELLAAA